MQQIFPTSGVPFSGGHPFQTNDLTILQAGVIDALKGLANGLGLNNQAYILQGITAWGTGHTAGYIYFNGEVYPVDAVASFAAVLGQQAYWKVIEDTISPSPVTYQDATSHIVHVRRRMYLVSAASLPADAISQASVVRLNQILGLTPQRGIIMYSGNVSNFNTLGLGKPNTQLDSWALCNGNQHSIPGTSTPIVTPDLRRRFIVGYDPDDSDYSTLDVATTGKPVAIGGEKTHTLTDLEVPHGTQNVDLVAGSGYSLEYKGINTGNSSPHENRPPYFTLCFIMKLL